MGRLYKAICYLVACVLLGAGALTSEAIAGGSHDHVHDHDHGTKRAYASNRKARRSMRARKAKRKKRGHDHAHHGHDHGHSPWSLGLGASISQSAGGAEAGGGHAGHNHAGHAHLALVEDEHDHEHEEEHAENGGGISPMFDLNLAYQPNEIFGIGVGLGYGLNEGLEDPSATISVTLPLARRLALASEFSATAPVSEHSQEHLKITTLSAALGPRYRSGKFSTELKGKFSYHMYQAAPEEDHEEEHLALVDEDHEEHDEHDEHGEAKPDYGMGGDVTLGYAMTRALSFNMMGSLTRVSNDDATVAWQTVVIPVQATYAIGSFSTNVGATLYDGGESPALPTTPGFLAGIEYEIN